MLRIEVYALAAPGQWSMRLVDQDGRITEDDMGNYVGLVAATDAAGAYADAHESTVAWGYRVLFD